MASKIKPTIGTKCQLAAIMLPASKTVSKKNLHEEHESAKQNASSASSAQVPECPSARVSNCLNVHLSNCLECPSALVPQVPKCLSARVPLECPLNANFLLSALRMKKRNGLANSFIEFKNISEQMWCVARVGTICTI